MTTLKHFLTISIKQQGHILVISDAVLDILVMLYQKQSINIIPENTSPCHIANTEWGKY